MIGIAEILRRVLAISSSGLRGGMSVLADGGKNLKPQSHIHTLLSGDVRIEGNMTFTGGLRIEGDIVGDVSAIGDANNTIVITKSGKITGEIRSQHVILNGQVHGSVHCARSVAILEHGRIVGDIVDCETIEVHEGGIIDGALTRTSRLVFEAQHRAQLKSA